LYLIKIIYTISNKKLKEYKKFQDNVVRIVDKLILLVTHLKYYDVPIVI